MCCFRAIARLAVGAWLLTAANARGYEPVLPAAGSAVEPLPPVVEAATPSAPDQPEFLALRSTEDAQDPVPPPAPSADEKPPEDPFLFPFLYKLIDENSWDQNADPVIAQAERIARRGEIDISDPGPDTVNFPNSPFTLPKGRLYFENSPFGYYGGPPGASNTFQWEFLLRYGLTDNLEFRIFSNGLTIESNPTPASGFSPIVFDLKLHLWEENKRYFLPAVGLEVYIQSGFGSPAFDSGTQPALSLLLDQTLPFGIEFNYAFSMTGLRDSIEAIVYQFGFQWAFQRELTDKVDVFVHGFYNDSAEPRLPGPDPPIPGLVIPNVNVVGAGALWTINDRVAAWGSCNAGTTTDAPPIIGLAGFALAF
ncbi:MAG: hypothetical protein U0836_05590 [Pirellulales bacterium]